MTVFDLPILDAHTHLSGSEYGEGPENILECLDACGISKAFIFAPLLNMPSWELSRKNLDDIRIHNDYCANLCSTDPERLLGFCFLNPAPGFAGGDLEEAVQMMIEEVKRCYHDLGLRGVKMIPNDWYPYDDKLMDLYQTIADLGMYTVFHSGIFLNGQEGRYCRPAYFEVVHEISGFKGHLAHLGWPWVDECIAVMTMETALKGQDPKNWDLKVDLSFGAPDGYQLDSWQKALSVLPPTMLIYGSDQFWPAPPEKYREKVLQPQLGLFEVATTLTHTAPEGSEERVKLRRQIFFDNVWSHWQAVVREPQQPKRAQQPISTPRAKSDPHSS
jgi:uncharacterized protein